MNNLDICLQTQTCNKYKIENPLDYQSVIAPRKENTFLNPPYSPGPSVPTFSLPPRVRRRRQKIQTPHYSP